VREGWLRTKKKRPMIKQRGGPAWLGCSKKETWKKKETVSKESDEGTHSWRGQNGRKVR